MPRTGIRMMFWKRSGRSGSEKMKFLQTIIACFFFLSLLFPPAAYADDIAVIVNEAGPLTEISEKDIREIYLGNMRFAKGAVISPIHYSEGSVKDTFLSSIVGMTSREYRLYWTKKVFQEGGAIPISYDNFSSIISSVQTMPGAIGYAPVSELAETKGIRIIARIKNR